jgi:endoglucanase
MNLPLLKSLSEAPGVPGREERVRALLEKETQSLFDETTTDNLGSLIAVKRSKSPNAKKVLLACHIDEIGFYVKHVDDKTGHLRLNNVGGFDTRNLLARRVRVQASGAESTGLPTSVGKSRTPEDLIGLLNPGGRPIHIAKEEDKKKIPEVGEFFVDLCLPPDEVKQKVRIGDPVTLVQDFAEIGQCVSGKCLDNRVAAFVAIEALRKAAHPKYDVILAATVQEEVGCRGAGPAAYAHEPDIAIAIDTTLCCDTPGVPEEERVTQQGAGVALTIMDSMTISNRGLIDSFEAVAKTRDIPFQLSILPRGGTDAGPMQRSRAGIKTMTLSIPTRYIHTVTECIHKRDLQAAIDLLAAWLDT